MTEGMGHGWGMNGFCQPLSLVEGAANPLVYYTKRVSGTKKGMC